MRTALEIAYDQAAKRGTRKHCHICNSREPFGPDGQEHRYLHTGNGLWECNYCNNQGAPI
jgi:hypothetical protein